MTVGPVVSLVRDKTKLDKVESSQSNIMVYCVESDGTNTLRPYQTPESISMAVPVLSAYKSSAGGVNLFYANVAPSIPANGIVLLEKFSCDYTINLLTNQVTAYDSELQVSFYYPYYTGQLSTCTITYITANNTKVNWIKSTAIGTLSEDRIYFTPKCISSADNINTVSVVRVEF